MSRSESGAGHGVPGAGLGCSHKKKRARGPPLEKIFLRVGIWPNGTNWITAQAGAAHGDKGSACSENRFPTHPLPIDLTGNCIDLDGLDYGV